MKKVFIVGYPRSGTTMFHGMLAAHSECLTFPETHFFGMFSENIIKKYINLFFRKDLKLVKKLTQEIITSNNLNIKNMTFKLWGKSNIEEWFLHLMDELLILNNKKFFLDKTPRHLYSIKQIEKYTNESIFIHIIRDPLQAANSLIKASSENKVWKKKYTIEDALNRWIYDLTQTLTYIDQKNHFIVTYESALKDPVQITQKLAEALDITWEESMLEPEKSFDTIVEKDEVWKSNNAKKLQNNNSNKDLEIEYNGPLLNKAYELYEHAKINQI